MSNPVEPLMIGEVAGGITPDDSPAIDEMLQGEQPESKVYEGKVEFTTPKSDEGTIRQIEKFLHAKWQFRYNQATNKVEWRTFGAHRDFVDMVDYDYHSLLFAIKRTGLSCSLHTLRALLASDFVPAYNPYTHYFDHLPPWDRETDYIEMLAQTVQTTNQAFWFQCFKKWLVATTASMVVPKEVNQTAIIFSGPQGVGKTRWFSHLMPEALRRYQFAGTLNLRDKDSQVKLSECPLIVMDELENMGSRNIDALKELITKQHIYLRRAYAYAHESFVRRASFAGSVNHHEFLHDMTGNRRFLCFEVREINPDHDIPLDLVFAQALHLYQEKFRFWFNQEEIAEINAHNEEFRVISLEEEQLTAFFEPCKEDDATDFLSATGILKIIAAATGIRSLSLQKLGHALNAKNFKRIKRNGRYVRVVRALHNQQTLD